MPYSHITQHASFAALNLPSNPLSGRTLCGLPTTAVSDCLMHRGELTGQWYRDEVAMVGTDCADCSRLWIQNLQNQPRNWRELRHSQRTKRAKRYEHEDPQPADDGRSGEPESG